MKIKTCQHLFISQITL
uniref:Uncharacterized protein n=1 Tax=Arundo donax TaxID=35708 RepID=A0A0A9QJJ0_ARUDO